LTEITSCTIYHVQFTICDSRTEGKGQKLEDSAKRLSTTEKKEMSEELRDSELCSPEHLLERKNYAGAWK
jgi:hypothetical protein